MSSSQGIFCGNLDYGCGFKETNLLYFCYLVVVSSFMTPMLHRIGFHANIIDKKFYWGVAKWKGTGIWIRHSKVRILSPQRIFKKLFQIN